LRDNPGAVKAIFQKGVKYAEQVRDHTKSAISIMLCGSGAGVMLPPYVVYQGANVYDAWCSRGPVGSVYSATKSGWFDMFTFTDWFKKIMLPHAKRLPGKKLLIGDNLSSHISGEVISLCKDNDIEFVCLPANSTDKMQPLDVGLFGPMKQAWRTQLRAYADKDPSAKLLQKSMFPKMLKELLDSLNPAALLPKAFEKCGLIPLNRAKVIERIPSTTKTAEIAHGVDQVLLKKLEIRRFGDGQKKRPRGKKIPAGESYSKQDEEEDDVSEQEDEEEEAGNEEVEADEEEVEEADSESENSVDEEEGDAEELPDLEGTSRIPGSFVVAIYEEEWYIAEVCKDQSNTVSGYVTLSYMSKKGTNSFLWPSKVDLHPTLVEDIILEPVAVEPINSRGHLGLKKKDFSKLISLMVVVYISNIVTFTIFFPFKTD
jgi:hypothetical protein